MRGQPWLRALLAVVTFALAALPVWRLTRAARAGAPGGAGSAESVPGVPAPAMPAAVAMRVEVTWSAPPGEWTLRHLNTPVLAGRGRGQTATGEWVVALPKEGADLALEAAAWPTGSDAAPPGPRAVRVLVTWPDGRTATDRTFWVPVEGGGRLAEIVTVPGAEVGDAVPSGS